MKNFSKIYMLPVAACLLFFGSCSNEDYLGGHVNTDGAGALMNVTAKVQSQITPDLTLAAGDVIGIAAGYGVTDVTARNREYVCQDDGTTFKNATGYPMYVKGATDVVAYFPYVGTDGAEPAITLDTSDQTNITNYYFAKAQGITPQNGQQVELVFSDAYARLNLSITTPAGETIHEYRLSGFAQKATVDPYTLDAELEAPADLSGIGTDITSLSLTLIPQTVAADAAVPARLVLIGSIRTYTIDLSDIQLTGGEIKQGAVNVTDGIGSIDFIPGGSTWTDSGLGGNVSAN